MHHICCFALSRPLLFPYEIIRVHLSLNSHAVLQQWSTYIAQFTIIVHGQDRVTVHLPPPQDSLRPSFFAPWTSPDIKSRCHHDVLPVLGYFQNLEITFSAII